LHEKEVQVFYLLQPFRLLLQWRVHIFDLGWSLIGYSHNIYQGGECHGVLREIL